MPVEFERLILRDADRDDLTRPAPDGGWGVVEILPHLRDWEDIYFDRAVAIAERIVCNPPRALRLTKRLMREAQHSRMSDILELSAAYQAIVHETADNREAINAFVEKRPPVFTGE